MRTQRQLEDARLIELSLLEAVIKTDSVQSNYREYKGVWMRTLTPGDTSLVREGREVVVHYQGRTTQGQVFDDSRIQEGPLRFVMGQEHQVIPGIEIGLERMHRGEVAELIIPSWLAFGGKGSVGGLVQPFSTVIYQVEVLELSIE
jgi:FKBP-type peptidyl-prolyl cis-trans isomerase